MNTSIKSVAAIALTFFSLTLSASDEEFKKEWNQTYSINNDASFKLTNKFGNVNITTWDQNQIQVDVVMTVNMKSETKAQEALDKIEIKEKSSATSVELETVFGNGKSDNSELSIDYTIKLPNSVKLDLRNDFGDMFVASMNASAVLRVEYGSLRAEKLNGMENNLIIQFSSTELDAMKGGEIIIDYGKLSIDDAGDLEIKSTFSAIDLDNGGSIQLNSKYDELEIDRIGSLDLDSKFTTAEIDELTGMLDAKVEYGGIEVDHIAKSFTGVKIDAEFGGVELEFEDGSSYTLEASAKMGGIDVPSGLKVTLENNEMMSKEIQGTIGSSPGSKKVIVNVQQGSVEID